MLGGLSPVSSSGSSKTGYLKQFGCLKHYWFCEGGTGTYAATDAISGAALQSNGWVSTGPFASYMSVLNEIVHHNINLSSGSWTQMGRTSSMWLLCGKFDGIFSFGFGDSTPNNIEIVFTQNATPVPFAFCKFNAGQLLTIPPVSDPFSTGLDSGVTSMLGFYIDEQNGNFGIFFTDVNGDYHGYELPISGYSDYTGCNIPATYSMGRDVVTSSLSGIVDLTAIAVFKFSQLPTNLSTDIEWMRDKWASGRKILPDSWKSL